MRIDVVYALPQRCWRWQLQLAEGACVSDALAAAPLEEAGLDRGDLPPAVGVFGREVMPDHRLRDGDRVELYRPLLCDPKAVRRERAERERQERPRSRPQPRARR
ncbi:RnfH family protein [Pseudomarimonas salicorniae]|uniref:UPF0125 protein M0G41_05500 n=1 Tax=Pseudomarimonas salicorniae TaxID=2933270 RepID=A0ABT0GF00_9GAMM|nr:RnfH family protein [Lysobacter sp. CAU 1642]MCK7593122.1 RnfH family protein [Lysobacter sp. CAU 1642]